MLRRFRFPLLMAPWAAWALVLHGCTEAARNQALLWLGFTFAWTVVMLGGGALLERRALRRPVADLRVQTRDLLASRLGVVITESPEATYRTIASTGALSGEWLGGFVQPGFIVSAASAARIAFGGDAGIGTDEYGASQYSVVKRGGAHIELRKQYDRVGAAELRYVGAVTGGTLTGFWYSPQRPSFCGVFWIARSERLTPQSRRALEGLVRSWSWRRAAAKGFVAALFVVVLAAALAGDHRIFFAALGLYMLALAVYRLRAQALAFEVARVRQDMRKLERAPDAVA